MPPVGSLTSDATGEPLAQEAKEARTGTLNPLDAATGATATLAGGVAQPDLGSPQAPWGTIHAQRLVVAGVEVNLQDIANFAPLLITRAGDAPDTGQHDQAFAWPFADLTRAFAVVVGPQNGGGGSASGFYVSLPSRLSPTAAVPFGRASDWGGLAGWLGIDDDDYVMTAADVKNLQEPGADGVSLQRTVLLEGLTLGGEVSLAFGTGGAGGVAVAGSPRGDTNGGETILLRDGASSLEITCGGMPSGFTHLATGGIRVAAGRVGRELDTSIDGIRKPANFIPSAAHDRRRLRGYFDGAREYLAAPVAADGVSPRPYGTPSVIYGRQSIGGAVWGAGGAQAEPIARLTSTNANANPGNPGGAGHNGYVLIFPRP